MKLIFGWHNSNPLKVEIKCRIVDNTLASLILLSPLCVLIQFMFSLESSLKVNKSTGVCLPTTHSLGLCSLWPEYTMVLVQRVMIACVCVYHTDSYLIRYHKTTINTQKSFSYGNTPALNGRFEICTPVLEYLHVVYGIPAAVKSMYVL